MAADIAASGKINGSLVLRVSVGSFDNVCAFAVSRLSAHCTTIAHACCATHSASNTSSAHTLHGTLSPSALRARHHLAVLLPHVYRAKRASPPCHHYSNIA